MVGRMAGKVRYTLGEYTTTAAAYAATAFCVWAV